MLLHHIFGSDRNRRRQRRRRRPLPHLYYDNMHTVNHLFWHLDHTDVGDEHSLADGGQLVCKSMSTQSYHGRGSAFRMKEKERKRKTSRGGRKSKHQPHPQRLPCSFPADVVVVCCCSRIPEGP